MRAESDEQGMSLVPWALLCLAAAVWLDFGAIHARHNADSLMPVLASVYRCTPYFWEQDRFGQLAAFLAWPCRELFGNLLLQSGIHLFAGLFAFILLGRYMLGRDTGPLVGAIGMLACLALETLAFHWHMWLAMMTGVWLSLGLAGLMLAEADATGRRRIVNLALACLCLVLAHVCYLTAGILLLPLVVIRAALTAWHTLRQENVTGCRPLVARALRLGLAPAAVVLVGIAGGYLGMLAAQQLPHIGATDVGASPTAEWLHSAWRLGASVVAELARSYWWCFLAICLGLGVTATVMRPLRPHTGACWLAAAALIAAALCFYSFYSTRTWVMKNDYCSRYLHGSIFMMQAAVVIVGWGPLVRALGVRARRGLSGAVAVGVLIALSVNQGRPSVAKARDALDRYGQLTPDLLSGRCTHIAGDYWTVWPAMFHANLVLHERNESRRIWGIAMRGWPTEKYWRTVPPSQMRVAHVQGDPHVDFFLRFFQLPSLQFCETLGHLQILTVKSGAASSASSL